MPQVGMAVQNGDLAQAGESLFRPKTLHEFALVDILTLSLMSISRLNC